MIHCRDVQAITKLTSAKIELTWTNTYKKPYKKAKFTIKKGASILFKKERLYLETDVSGVRLAVSPVQARDEIQFPNDEAPYNSVLQQNCIHKERTDQC